MGDLLNITLIANTAIVSISIIWDNNYPKCLTPISNSVSY